MVNVEKLRKDFRAVWKYWIDNGEETEERKLGHANDIKAHENDEQYMLDVANLYREIANRLRV